MRLIDADALLEGIAELKQSPWYENFSGRFFRKEAVEIIEDLCIKKEPTIDAVEVVRCKDCIYGEIDDEDFLWQYYCQHNGDDWNDENHYCGYGERKNEDCN